MRPTSPTWPARWAEGATALDATTPGQAHPADIGDPVGETVLRHRHHQQQLAVQVGIVQHRDQMRALRVSKLLCDLDLALDQPGLGSSPSAGVQPDADLLDRDCAALAVLAAEDVSQRTALSQGVRRVIAVLASLIAGKSPHRRIRGLVGGQWNHGTIVQVLLTDRRRVYKAVASARQTHESRR
jgi:hypothetical protein